MQEINEISWYKWHDFVATLVRLGIENRLSISDKTLTIIDSQYETFYRSWRNKWLVD